MGLLGGAVHVQVLALRVFVCLPRSLRLVSNKFRESGIAVGGVVVVPAFLWVDSRSPIMPLGWQRYFQLLSQSLNPKVLPRMQLSL